jgi:hypothetical protein
MVTKLPCKLTKGHTMSNTTDLQPKQTLEEQHLPTTPTIPNICQPGDKECIARLVQAFSDCD